MKEYTLSYITGSPDWETLPVLNIDTPYLETKDNVAAFGQIAYSDDAFWVHLWAEVPEVRAVENGPLGMPCEDSCLEFFFQPVSGDPRYINLEFNINKCFYLGFGTGIHDLIRLVPEENMLEVLKPETKVTEKGWEIFYQIPYAVIRRIFPSFAPAAGESFRANCFACSDLTVPHYYLSWNSVSTDNFTFHQSDCFGVMKYENH